MKKAILISLATLVALSPAATPAETAPARASSFTVLLAGGTASNVIHIWMTSDGRNFVIDSIVPLEVGGHVCSNPEGNPNELICPTAPIAGFEVNADGGDDKIVVHEEVSIPVTMRGGSGNDVLLGGRGADKLSGGSDDDRLVGGWGADLLAGGPGDDVHIGGPGDDVILTGPGHDVVRPGTGRNVVRSYQPGGPTSSAATGP